jgi:hypothetical protein
MDLDDTYHGIQTEDQFWAGTGHPHILTVPLS